VGHSCLNSFDSNVFAILSGDFETGFGDERAFVTQAL
jgi:hypothetical protein